MTLVKKRHGSSWVSRIPSRFKNCRYICTATWMGLRWPMPSKCPWAPCNKQSTSFTSIEMFHTHTLGDKLTSWETKWEAREHDTTPLLLEIETQQLMMVLPWCRNYLDGLVQRLGKTIFPRTFIFMGKILIIHWNGRHILFSQTAASQTTMRSSSLGSRTPFFT